jgi:hypothetical protein
MTTPPRVPQRQFRTTRTSCLCEHAEPEPSTGSREMQLSSGASVVLPLCGRHARKYDQAIRLEVLSKERYGGVVPSQHRR